MATIYDLVDQVELNDRQGGLCMAGLGQAENEGDYILKVGRYRITM